MLQLWKCPTVILAYNICLQGYFIFNKMGIFARIIKEEIAYYVVSLSDWNFSLTFKDI